MASACPECGSLLACPHDFAPPWDPRVDLQAAGGFAMAVGMEMEGAESARLRAARADREVYKQRALRAEAELSVMREQVEAERRMYACLEENYCAAANSAGRADAALAAAEALEARYRTGIRRALAALHAVHGTLPDGESIPRQSADALALAVEGALLAVLGGES